MAGRVGSYKTPLEYDNRAAGVTGKQQRRYSGWAANALCVCRARQTAHWMSRQIQANSRGDRDGAATISAKRTKFSGICRRGNRTPLESVTVRHLPANTLGSGLQMMEQISPRPSRLVNLPVYILRDPLS